MPRSLYPVDVTKRIDYRLAVGEQLSSGERHELFITELGNSNGYPAVFFHGGPGDGCNDKKAGNFNPQFYRIILIDQRGAGKSTPSNSLEQNTTQDLLADMETVRQHLNIDKWVIAGTSWGTTLALLYAEKYPQHVAALVLRGVFLARAQDIGIALKDNSTAAAKYPIAWNEFTTVTSELLWLTHIPPQNSYSAIYFELLSNAPLDIKLKAAKNLLRWNGYCLGLKPIVNDQLAVTEADVDKLLIELSYDVNNYYLSPNQILQNIYPIVDAKIPVHIIHGMGDMICPTNQTNDLESELAASQVQRVNVFAGHVSEPETEDAMVNATDAIARNLSKKPSMPSLATNQYASFQIRANPVEISLDKPSDIPAFVKK